VQSDVCVSFSFSSVSFVSHLLNVARNGPNQTIERQKNGKGKKRMKERKKVLIDK
jgi:hypothetical protein